MTTPRQAFDAERSAQLQRYTQLHASTRAEIIAALEAARTEINAQLADAPSEWQQSYLQRLRPQVEASIRRFQARGTGAWVDGVQQAWQAGSDLVEQPLIAAGDLARGQLQRINDRALLGMQTFLTGKMSDVAKEARQRIDAQLALALTGTQSNSQTIAGINAILGGSSRRRAITITRTELGRAHAAASYLQLQQAAERVPGLKKQWRRSGKRYSRIEHDAADGQIREIDEPFDVGGVQLMYPRDPTAPAKHTINCGCTMLPAKPDWKVANASKRPFSLEEIAANPRRRDANQAIAEQAARDGVALEVPGIIASEVRTPPALATALREIEPRIAEEAREHGYLLDQSGKVLWQGIAHAHRPDVFQLPDVVKVPRGLVLTHQHPSGQGPSVQDLFVVSDYSLAELRVVTLDSLYRLLPLKNTALLGAWLRSWAQDNGPLLTGWKAIGLSRIEISRRINERVIADLQQLNWIRYERSAR